MTDPRRPDHSIVDDDVEGHGIESGRVQPPRDDSGDVEGHGLAVRPESDEREHEEDVEGHVYVRPEDQSRES